MFVLKEGRLKEAGYTGERGEFQRWEVEGKELPSIQAMYLERWWSLQRWKQQMEKEGVAISFWCIPRHFGRHLKANFQPSTVPNGLSLTKCTEKNKYFTTE